MAEFTSMGRFGAGGARVSAAMFVAGVALLFGAGPAVAASGGGAAIAQPTVTAPTTTTLPPLPKVPAADTDGQTAQTLLANAISLASLGVDDTALIKAVGATQAKLDSDALQATTFADQAQRAKESELVAQTAAARAGTMYAGMAGAIKQAVIYLYTSGPASLAISPKAGLAALYAQDYADSTVGPYGILAQGEAVEADQQSALKAANRESKLAAAAASRAASALKAQQRELDQLKAELVSVAGASAASVAADHVTLANQAGRELLTSSSLQFTPKAAIQAPVSTTSVALTWAFAELGKEYVWGATGPDTFDCSGLTQFVWKAAGVSIPRVAADQYAWTIPVPLSQLLPGDLVFFGTTDIHHVGIYIGDGLMINAPHTGTVVQVSSIWWSDLAGFGRVHYSGTPVPPHDTPSPLQPAAPTVVPKAGPVPSQAKPPAGWKPKPGQTTPIALPVAGPSAGGPGPGPNANSGTTVPSSTTTSTPVPDSSSTSLPDPVEADGATAAPTTTTTSSTTSVPAGLIPSGP